MALTNRVMIDSPTCLAVLGVDESKSDGAIGSVTITNRSTGYDLWVWATYNGSVITSPTVYPGQVYTRTFRGASARAGDVSEIGYYMKPHRGV